jgi:hypothetical protein
MASPRLRALAKAALLAAETAERSTDPRHLDEAQRLRDLWKAEIERVPGAPEKTRRYLLAYAAAHAFLVGILAQVLN